MVVGVISSSWSLSISSFTTMDYLGGCISNFGDLTYVSMIGSGSGVGIRNGSGSGVGILTGEGSFLFGGGGGGGGGIVNVIFTLCDYLIS